MKKKIPQRRNAVHRVIPPKTSGHDGSQTVQGDSFGAALPTAQDPGKHKRYEEKTFKLLERQTNAAERQVSDARLTLWVSVVALTISVVGAYFVIHQTNIATSAMIHDNRAWIGPDKMDFLFHEGDSSSPILVDIVGDNINYGKEPAIDLTFSPPLYDALQIRSYDNFYLGIPPMDCAQFVEELAAGKMIASKQSIFPGNQWSFEQYIPMTSTMLQSLGPKIRAVEQGSAIFYYETCAAYKTFSEWHVTGICWYKMRDPVEKNVRVFHCPFNNEAT